MIFFLTSLLLFRFSKTEKCYTLDNLSVRLYDGFSISIDPPCSSYPVTPNDWDWLRIIFYTNNNVITSLCCQDGEELIFSNVCQASKSSSCYFYCCANCNVNGFSNCATGNYSCLIKNCPKCTGDCNKDKILSGNIKDYRNGRSLDSLSCSLSPWNASKCGTNFPISNNSNIKSIPSSSPSPPPLSINNNNDSSTNVDNNNSFSDVVVDSFKKEPMAATSASLFSLFCLWSWISKIPAVAQVLQRIHKWIFKIPTDSERIENIDIKIEELLENMKYNNNMNEKQIDGDTISFNSNNNDYSDEVIDITL